MWRQDILTGLRLESIFRACRIGLLILLFLLAACQSALPEASIPTEETVPLVNDGNSTIAIDSEVEVVGYEAVGEVAEVEVQEESPLVLDAEDEGVDEDRVAAGMAAYRTQYCGICHTLETVGTTGTFGPPHDGVGATAESRILDARYTGSAQTAAEYLRESIINPQIYIVDGYAATTHSMPSYAHLTEDELQAIVDFLLTQR